MKWSWNSSLVARLLVGLILILPVGSQAESVPVGLSIPHVVVNPGEPLSLPVSVEDPGDATIYAISFEIVYNADVLDLTEVVRGTELNADWELTPNLFPGRVHVSMAGSTPLAQGGELIVINGDAVGAPSDDTTLRFVNPLFNEGEPEAATVYGLVQLTAIPQADFSLPGSIIGTGQSVAFTDLSEGDITSWSWNFGDGQTSDLQNPTHIYFQPDVYTVTLQVIGPVGSTTVQQSIQVINPPQADFSADNQSGAPPLGVQFNNQSSGSISSYLWDFGDGSTSGDQSPYHVYGTPGSYVVSLTVTGPGGTSTSSQGNFVNVVYSPPTAGFAASNVTGVAPLAVSFADQSAGEITSRSWNFGDDSSSADVSPSHTYAPGIYTVSLTVTGPGGSDDEVQTDIIQVFTPAQADFSASGTQLFVGEQVTFTNQSVGDVDSFAWSFGDGGIDTAVNPTYAYAEPGIYTVSLTASGLGGSHGEAKVGYIAVSHPPPAAAFSAANASGDAPLTVNFTDASTGLIDASLWDFGDGNSSTAIHPTHTYAEPGVYTVTLTVTGPGGVGTETQTDLVQVFEPLFADFDLSGTRALIGETITFTDRSLGEITSYAWDFGDGNSSTEQNPSHAYGGVGTYTASLTVTGPRGTDTVVEEIQIFDSFFADFDISPPDPLIGETITFTDRSSGEITSYAWNFGDGNSGSGLVTSHIYAAPGPYTVSLTVSGPAGGNTANKEIHILQPAQANFDVSSTQALTGDQITFTDISTGDIDTYTWDFGDGSSSSGPVATHIYAAPGPYTAVLTVSGPGTANSSTASLQIQVGESVRADFDPSAFQAFVGDEIIFTDLSTGDIVSRDWLFGDGVIETDVTDLAPAHTYTRSGDYAVTLTVRGLGGKSSAVTKVISVWSPVQALFDLSSDRLEIGEEVLFSDLSSGDIVTYTWDFGDGSPVSGEIDPAHAYASGGLYTVSLTVDGGGGDFSTFTQEVLVTNPPTISPPIEGKTATEGGTVFFTLNGNETDDRDSGTALNWSASLLEGADLIASFDTDGGATDVFFFTAQPDASGLTRILFTLTDSDGRTDSQEVVLTWEAVADPPTVTLMGPANNAPGMPTSLVLNWEGTDPDPDDQLTYDVHLGFSDSPPLQFSGLTFNSLLLTDLVEDGIYYWQVVATDATGLSHTSPVWNFATVPDTKIPVIISGPTVLGVTHQRATIQWSTDESTIDQFELGLLQDLSDAQTTTGQEAATEHAAQFDQLDADVTYYFRVTAIDAAGNPSAPKTGNFHTLAAPDQTPPQITSGPSTQGITHQEATVQWSTDEATTGTVEFGLLQDLSDAQTGDSPDLAAQHSLTLVGLAVGTTYYYRVTTTDAADNPSAPKTGSFRTKAAPDTSPPKIVSGPGAQGITHQQATVQWSTDEVGTSTVEYGPTPGLGFFQQQSQAVLSHAVVLTGLEGDTPYYYRVYSIDPSENKSLAKSGSFKTLAAPDITPPQILTGPIPTGLDDQSATVRWTTNEVADSYVEFSVNQDLSGSRVLLQGDPVLAHAVTLTNLEPATTYHYQVHSIDVSDNPSAFKGGEFTTLAAPDIKPPQLLQRPIAVAVTDVSARIEWETDEDADVRIDFGAGILDQVIQRPDRLRRQSVPLTNLEPETEYQFQVTLADFNGNETASALLSFRTLAAPDLKPPKISAGPLVTMRLDDQAVVEWITDELADSEIHFGLDATYGDGITIADDVVDHAIHLTGLEPETAYHYQICSTDASDNGPACSADFTFTTLAAPDQTPPKILTGPIAGGLDDQSATIRWTTNEIADSYLRVGLQSDLSDAQVFQLGELTLAHAVILTNLEPATTYYYQVRSTDVSENPSALRGGEFTTLAAPDLDPPQVLRRPVAVAVTDQSARIEWETDEDADARIDFGVGGLDQVIQRPEQQRQQSVPLTNLEPSTEYQFQVTLADFNGNETVSGLLGFRTLAAPDLAPPKISAGPLVTMRLDDQAVIEWITDELADSEVRFGMDATYGEALKSMDDELNHAVRLTGLEPETAYHYQVCSTDASDNGPVCSADFTFTTLAAPDQTPPKILTGPNATGLDDQSATLRWTTNEVADSYVKFSVNQDLSQSQVLQLGDPTLAHAVTLTNLEPATTYYYQVRSTDVSDNPSSLKGGEFTTLAAPDILPPLVLTGPVAVAITDVSARIEWATDEDADARIDFGIDAFDQVVQRSEQQREQSVPLTNLKPETKYKYRLTLTDLKGNQKERGPFTFRTLAAPDLDPPVITAGPAISTRLHDQVVIEWTTDEASDSELLFGLDATYGEAATSMDDVTEHAIRLTNLEPATTYHYQVRSTDPSDNGPGFSADQTFTTLDVPDETPPQITAAPVVLNRTDKSAAITWTTDELADGFVEFGIDATYGLVAGSAEHSLKHEVQLTNLEPATTYFYRVRSTDPAGNAPTFSDGNLSFFTKAAPDLLPPNIVNDPVVIARTQTAATIQWVTDEPSDSRLSYGLNATYGQEVVLPEDVVVHTVNLTNLDPDTEYHYRAASVDASDNDPTLSDDQTFTTLAAPDETPPRLLSGPTVRNITSGSATIEWVTDEPSNSVVDVGTDLSYGLSHIERGERVELHVVPLANLQPATTYHFKITSTDGSSNVLTTDYTGTEPHSQDHAFNSLAQADDNPPIFLEGPVVYARDQAASVEFTTDEDVRYEIILDTAAALNSPQREVLQNNSFGNRHSINLTNLQRGTFYYYRLTIWDQVGNSRVASTAGAGGARGKRAKLAQPPGGAGNFVTQQDPDTQFPVIISPPVVTAKTASSLTIEWETDERSDSFIQFGGSDQFTELDGSSADVLRHRVVLTNLQPGQTYQYQTNSTDPSGNGATRSAKLVATTDLELDLTPPQILTAPQIAWLTDQSATIEWTTDEQSTSIVQFGTEALDLRREDPELTTQHRITLTNLTPGTAYKFQTSSVDGSNNGPTLSSEITFQTDPGPDLTLPVIDGSPEVVNLTDQTATILWKTDELADSFVEYGTREDALDVLVGAPEDVLEHRITLTNLAKETTYFFKIGSIDRSNNGPVESEILQFTTSADRDLDPPAIPASLAAQPGSEAVWIGWTANQESDFAGYNVYRRTADGESFQLVASLLQDPEFVDKGLTDDATYAYQVTAVDNATPPNESVPTVPVESTPSAGNVPGAPSNGVVVSAAKETATLRIDNATPIAGRQDLTYTFQVSTDQTFADVVARDGRIAEGTGGVTEWTFSRQLAEEVEYWWRARASDGLFDGPWMAPASFEVGEGVGPIEPVEPSGPIGDFDGDLVVNFNDFFLFADHFGLTETDPTWDSSFDLSVSGRIDFDDFFLFADHFGEQAEASKPTVTVDTEADIRPQLRLLDITPRSAVLAVDVASTLQLQGYGVVLKHLPEVEIQLAPQDAQVHAQGEDRRLEGLLRTDLERSWFGTYRFAGDAPDGMERIFEASFEFPPEAIGSQISLEELWAVDTEGRSYRLTEVASAALTPQVFSLAPPYPNPFNPSVQLDYSLPEQAEVELQIYNILGQRIRTLVSRAQDVGFYRATWEGTDDHGRSAGSGIYFIRLEAGSHLATRKVLMLK